MLTPRDEIEQMLADLEKRESKLSDWERSFVDSVAKQFGDRGDLSQKQEDKLTEIWDRATS